MGADDPKPVYVMYGSDAFLRDETRRTLIAEIIANADPQTALANFDATAELSQVLDELRTLPFLAPRRAVIVSDADAFVSAYRESLEKYLQSPSKASSLILIVSSWPKTTRLYKLVSKIGKAIDCTAPDERKLLAWIRNAAQKRHKKISPETGELLLAWRGADMAALDGELEKLSLYVGKRESITADDVSTLVTATAGPVAFALTNTVTRGKIPAALEALSRSITRRGEEFKILGMLGWYLRKALHAQQLIQSGMPPGQACKTAGVFYQQRDFLDMLRRRSVRVLQDDFRKLLSADLWLKTGADPTTVLQELIVALCS